MRVTKITLVCLCLAACVTTALGQSTSSIQRPTVQIDPRTGEFRMMQPDFEVQPVTTPTTGTFVVNFTITISSTLPTADVISCTVTAAVLDVGSTFQLIESAALRPLAPAAPPSAA
jgi:hypothetical protein